MTRAAPAIPLFGDAYIADTRHLSLEEHGAYLQLLMIAWRTEDCSLPDDDKRIAQMLGVTPKKWASIKPAVMAFWTLEKGRWTQKRLTKERRFVAKKRQEQSERAAAKWGSSDDNRLKRSERLSAARQKGRHTAAQWDALVEATGGLCVKCHAQPDKVVKDHIIPLYQGGSDAISNLQPLCQKCNCAKGPERADYRLSVCKDLFERLPECLPSGGETPAPPPPPTYSDTNVSGDEPPIDPVKVMFDAGITLLGGSGLTAKAARAMIGKWRRDNGDDAVRLAVAEAQAARISDPVPWIEARFSKRGKPLPDNRLPGEPMPMWKYQRMERERTATAGGRG